VAERIKCDAGRYVRVQQVGPGAGALAIHGIIENYETSSMSIVLSSEPPDSWHRSPVRVSSVGPGKSFSFEGQDVRFRMGEPSWCSIEFEEPMFATESIVHARANFGRLCGFFIPDARSSARAATYSALGLIDECSFTGMTVAFDNKNGQRLMTDRSLIVNFNGTDSEPLLILAEIVEISNDPYKEAGRFASFVFADLDEVVRPNLERQVGLQLLKYGGLLAEDSV